MSTNMIDELRRLADSKVYLRENTELSSSLYKLTDDIEQVMNDLETRLKALQIGMNTLADERDNYKQKYEDLSNKVLELAFDLPLEASTYVVPPFPGTKPGAYATSYLNTPDAERAVYDPKTGGFQTLGQDHEKAK
jgi:hypothetical protein